MKEVYVQRYTDISREAADYYKQEAINMYMTEQFCKGDKYMKLKNRDLIQKATKSNRVDLEKEA